MDAPKCKICDKRHYGPCAATRSSTVERSAFNRDVAGSSPAESAKPSKAKFDRNSYQREYMREYMRKRRAAARGA